MATSCSHLPLTSRALHDGVISRSTSSSSMHLRIFSSSAHNLLHLHPKLALPLLQTSTLCFAGTSSYVLVRPPRHVSRAMRSSESGMVGVIKAAIIFEWIENLIKFITKGPIQLFAQKIEADLDKAAKLVKTGASIVVEIAKEANELAEQVERIAEKTEEFAEKVAKTTETIEERVDEVLDVIEGEKKMVITSYKLVDNLHEVAVTSTTIAKDGNQSTVETSVVNDSIPDNSSGS